MFEMPRGGRLGGALVAVHSDLTLSVDLDLQDLVEPRRHVDDPDNGLARGCLQHRGESTRHRRGKSSARQLRSTRSRDSRPSRWGRSAGASRDHRAFLEPRPCTTPDARISPNHTPRSGRRLDCLSRRKVPPTVRSAILRGQAVREVSRFTSSPHLETERRANPFAGRNRTLDKAPPSAASTLGDAATRLPTAPDRVQT